MSSLNNSEPCKNLVDDQKNPTSTYQDDTNETCPLEYTDMLGNVTRITYRLGQAKVRSTDNLVRTNASACASASVSNAGPAMGIMSPKDSNISDCGEFVDSDIECEVEELAEEVDRYFNKSVPYCPIHIGQVLVQTYRIEHKLGHGGFSTVWLARDINKNRDVALKIMVPGEAAEYELSMQNEIMRTVQDTSNLIIYKDTFVIPGFQGDHRVLVFPVRGPCLGSYYIKQQMSLAARMSAAKQLLTALKCLHDGGIVHRDLNEMNVMWGIAPLDNYNTKTKYEFLGRPQKIALDPHPGWQAEMVKPMEVPESLIEETFYLGDFGLAIKVGTSVSNKAHSPVIYRAPEQLHNADPSFSTDMWSYMCLFAELYLGFNPFDGWFSSVVLSIVDTLGPMPEHWKGDYKYPIIREDSWYDQSRKPRPERTLAAMIKRARPEASQTETDNVLSVMSKGFSYLPESRMSAAQLLEDASFKTVMQIYQR